ncbi:MAG: metalloregulator ArsR/SmtB family transcription factor [archaeon]|nr:metalloregulator ArsR/SmtB family transcription factor [archaeon]
MSTEISILKALADETRLKIIETLLEGKKCVSDIFPKVNRTQSTVSIHLGNLEEAGILSSKREGKKVFYEIKNTDVSELLNTLKSMKCSCNKECCKEVKK